MGDNSNSRPADVLVDGWERAKPVAFDVTVTTPLTPATLVMLVNQQKLQLTHQSVESILPMTKSVWCWDGSVLSLLLKHMAMGVKRPNHYLMTGICVFNQPEV